MTIQNENQAAAGAAASQQTESFAQAAPQRSFSWSGIARPAGLSRNATSACLAKSVEVMTEALKALPVDPSVKLALVRIDNAQEVHLRASGLAVVAFPADAKDKRAAYYTLILEGSTEPIPSRTENVGGVNVIVDVYSEAIFDNRYMETVEALVSRSLPGYELYPNSGTVVPRDFPWTDAEAVRNLLISGGLAAANGLDVSTPGWQDLNAALASKTEALQVTPGFHQNNLVDYVGQPIYTDLRLGLDVVSTEKPADNTVNTKDRSTPMARIGGFIDLAWLGDTFGQNQNQFGMLMQQGPKPKFAARLVCTALENTLTYSIGSQLLALAATHQLAEGTNWFPAFLPQPGALNNGPVKGVDLKDIGAINIEANINNEAGGFGTPFDTKSNTVTPLDIGRLLVSTIAPGLSLALDVSRCGTDTWVNEVFAAAASGDLGAQRAILMAADTLTNGQFGNFYTGNESPVVQNNEVILTGYFEGQDGQRHDLRELGYLAAANLVGKTDPAFLAAWSDTFLRADIAIERRLADRRNMTKALVPSAVFTGTAQRVNFTTAFMEALVKGLVQAGVVFKLGSANNVEFQNNRGAASWVDQTRLNTASSGLFQNGYQPRQQAGFGNRGFASRWG